MSKKLSKKFASVFESECVACGTCMKVCPRDAITIPKGIFAMVNSLQCVGCGLCANACPASVISIKNREEKENEYGDEKEKKVV